MNGKGSVQLDAGIEKAWDVLMDPEILANCIMGCEKLNLVEEGVYRADLQVGIAAVKGSYSSTIELTDLEKPKHYKMIVKGEGGPGHVEATGIVDLESVDENTTKLNYSYEADVGGKVAMVGQRMLGGVAKMIIKDFFKKFSKEIDEAVNA